MRLILAVFVLATAFVTLGVQAQSRGGQPASVLIQPIGFEYEETTVEAVGTAEALKSVTLFPAVADKVAQVNFRPGQSVSKGDVLLRLDSRRQEVAMQRAKIQLKDAQRNFQRLLDSQKRGAAAQSDLDDSKTLLELAEVAYKEAQTNLEDRVLRAPFDGILGLSDIEVGDRINEQTAVTTIDQRSSIYVNFNAPESSLQVLLQNPEVTLQPWSNRNTYLDATIAQIDSRINAVDRTLRVRALLRNELDAYRPGMSFRVSLTLKGNQYASIPEAALSWGAEGAYVWKSVDNKAHKVDVAIKQRLKGRILVEGELVAGDSLIVEGIQRLRIGQAVKPIVSEVADARTTESDKSQLSL